MAIEYREARADDTNAIAELMEIAAGGLSDFLLTNLILGMNPRELVEAALTDENTPFHFSNIIVAEDAGNVVGAVNFYPANQHGVPDIMRSIVPAKRLAVFEPFYNSKVPDSFYIHALAVSPKYRQSSIAIDLFKFCKEMATTSGYEYMSAHVWADNTSVVNILKMAGFSEVERIHIKPHKLLPYKKGMVLLKSKPLSAQEL